MEVKTLYKYTRENGAITVSPIQPKCAYTEMFRLISGGDKLLTKDGITLYSSIDVDFVDGWYEVDNSTELQL